MMPLVHIANFANSLHRSFIANVAAKRIARVGGIRDHTTTAHDFSRAFDQPGFGMCWVESEKLAQSAIPTAALFKSIATIRALSHLATAAAFPVPYGFHPARDNPRRAMP
jgi:hypothetical protein